jgi:hypothetical protein
MSQMPTANIAGLIAGLKAVDIVLANLFSLHCIETTRFVVEFPKVTPSPSELGLYPVPF